MASGACTTTPGKTYSPTDTVQNADLNLLAQPSVQVNAAAITSRELAAGALGQTFAGQTTIIANSGSTPGIYQSIDFVQGLFLDGVGTIGSTTFTSATAVFTVGDNGRVVFGVGIPVGTTITYVNGTTVTLSNNYLIQYSDGVITSTTTLTSATAVFTVSDTGRTIIGTGIPAGTTVTYVSATQVTLSQAGTNATGVVFQVNGRTNTASFGIVGRAKGWELIVDASGNGALQTSFLFGTVGFGAGTFTILNDGTLSVGSGSTMLRASPNGDFLWGTGSQSLGITHDGKIFFGAPDFADAILSVDQNGNPFFQGGGTVNPNVATDFFNPALNNVIFSPSGGAIINPTSLSMNCTTRYSRIYYRTFLVDGVSNTDTSWVSASGAFTIKDVGKTIVASNIPANTFIKSVTNATTLVLSAATTSTATALQYYIIPDQTDTLYVNGTPISLTATTNVASRAYKSGEYSALTTALFSISASIVPNPIFSPVPDTYGGGSQVVNLSDTLAGSVIFYTKTIDGSTPADPAHDGSLNPTGTTIKINSTSGNVTITTGTVKFKIMGSKTALTDSAIVPGTYVITSGSSSGGGGGGSGGGGGHITP